MKTKVAWEIIVCKLYPFYCFTETMLPKREKAKEKEKKWGKKWLILKNIAYYIFPNCFRGSYSFLYMALYTVTFDHSTYRCGNYSREETIQGQKLFAEIRYLLRIFFFLLLSAFKSSKYTIKCHVSWTFGSGLKCQSKIHPDYAHQITTVIMINF